MRPLDVFSEKNIRDGSPDKIACSSALVYEAHSLAVQTQFLKADKKQDVQHDSKSGVTRGPDGKVIEGDFNSAIGFGKRDQMALASLAFCNPLMMLGMGAALGLSDNMRLDKEAALKEAPLRRLRQGAIERQQDVTREKALPASAAENTAAVSRLNLRLAEKSRKPKLEFQNRRENVLYPSQAWRQPDQEKSWVKASKLVKRKQQMMDQLAKCRGLLSLNIVSAILSKIELLDKELKKMGC